MAAFSYYQHPHPSFLLDSVFLPNSTHPIKAVVSDIMEEGSFNPNLIFSQFHPESSSCRGHSSTVALSPSDNEPSSTVTKKQSTESSTVVDKLESGEQVTQTVNRIDHKKRKNRIGKSSSISALTKGAREAMKSKKQKKCNDVQPNMADKTVAHEEEEAEAPKGYIHVRARRGQATDSHSLAERVRREKISERMNALQKLVPGCDKVTGKALMLDEIINYVQSLQNQVEFLSMRLASVNPMLYDFGMDLDTFMARPERSVPQCSSPNPTQITAFAADDSYPYLLQQGQRPPDAFSQGNSSVLWDVMEDQKQKFLNPTGFSNNLYPFH